MLRFASAVLFVSLAGVAASAQTSVPPNQVTPFKDTSFLKPHNGAKVAILDFEDLECPACSRAFPVVHEAAKHYNIPLERHDFPLKQIHKWSPQAAIYARYMQDKIAPDYAEDYRRQVFASQFRISSLDDLNNFTKSYLSSHGGKSLPFAMDPIFAKEVDADAAIGDRIGLNHTPTIVVVTPKGWIEVIDVMQLYTAIDTANAAMAGSGAAPARPVARNTSALAKK